jgi:acetylornithine/N-succinyldiaminopimelate aminotransferase
MKISSPSTSQTNIPVLEPAEQESYQRDDERYVGQTTPFGKALIIVHAEGSTVWTADGRQYLDFIAGMAVNNVGHNHPEVRAALIAQAEHMLHVNVYGKFLIPSQVDLARRLAQVTPPGLEKTFFTNSGTEAIEGALKLARISTGRANLVAFKGGFHGRTLGALSVSWREIYRKPFEPLLPGVSFIPHNDLKAAEAAIDQNTAGVIVEPIQGEGGVRVPADDFLPGLRELCDRQGALLILDEIQTGFGRTGRFFGCQHWDVVPDVLVVAKALGGGMPLGGFISRPELMDSLLEPPLAHMTTFGGHPVSCAAGLASLEIICRDSLPERAERLGRQVRASLTQWMIKYSDIKEVRGKGLLIGLEFTEASRARAFVSKAMELGLILSWTVYSGSTVRLAPPLNISESDLSRGMAIIEEAVSTVCR